MVTKNNTVDYLAIRAKFSGTYIANNGYDLIKAKTAIEKDNASLIVFGVPFLANPNLVYRYRENLSLNKADPVTFYGGDEVSYTDYPIYNNN